MTAAYRDGLMIVADAENIIETPLWFGGQMVRPGQWINKLICDPVSDTLEWERGAQYIGHISTEGHPVILLRQYGHDRTGLWAFVSVAGGTILLCAGGDEEKEYHATGIKRMKAPTDEPDLRTVEQRQVRMEGMI